MREDFTYDNLNRLTSSNVFPIGGLANINPTCSITYDQTGTLSQGNIMTKTDVGSYQYGGFPRHAVKYVNNTPQQISKWRQDITYTPFLKTEKVKETDNQSTYNYEQIFTYDAAYERVKSVLTENGTTQQTRYYMDGYEYNVNGNEYIYYVPGGDGLCAIVEHCTSIYNPSKDIHYVYKDHLGSILTVTDENGTIEAEQNFDAWGRSRNPQDWTDYANISTPPSWLYRGYTGHEHMPEFALINMNGRMYDPLLGRMLSPDIFTFAGTQGYNRYSYCHNNPLSYVDPDGNHPLVVAVAVGAAIGAASYTYSVAVSPGGFKNWDWGNFAFGTFSGALSGAVTWGIGTAFQVAAASGPFLGGTVGQEIGRAAVHGYFGYINGAMSGNAEAGFWSAAASSLAGSIGAHIPILNTDGGGALMSAAVGGMASSINGGDFLEGAIRGLTVHLFNQAMHDRVVSLKKWAKLYEGKTYNQIAGEGGRQSYLKGLLRPRLGPIVRYVDIENGIILDMRHVLVVGIEYGLTVGEAIEIGQILSDPASAMNSKDLLSNEIGASFLEYLKQNSVYFQRSVNFGKTHDTNLSNHFYNYVKSLR